MKRLNYLADILLVLAVCLLIGVTSCRTSLETRCAEMFPVDTVLKVRVDLRTDTLVTPSVTIEYLDTTQCPPHLPDTLTVIKTRRVELPGDTIIREIECIDTISVYQDAAKLAYLNKENARLNQALKTARGNSATRLWIIIGLGIVAAVFAFLLFKNNR